MKHTTSILLVAVLAVAQFAMAQSEEPQRNSQGYGYGAIGSLRGPGGFSGASQIGGGAEGTFYKGLGAGIDVGYLFPTSAFSAGFGTLSPGVLYQFSPKRRTVPFVTGGYTLGFRDGAMNMIHFGGGATYWFSERVGLRVEVRDHMPTQSTDYHYLVVRFGITGR